MGFDEDVRALADFFDAYQEGERRLDSRTAPKLVTLGNGFASARKPCNMQALQDAANVSSRNFGYEQLGRGANWPRQARSVLGKHAASTAPDGKLLLGLHSTATPDDRHEVLRLVTISTEPQVVDCVAYRATEPIGSRLGELLSRLAAPWFRGVSITVVDAKRIVAPLAHPVRMLPGDIEYVVRASGRDETPIVQTEMFRDHRSPEGRNFSDALLRAPGDLVHVRDARARGRLETLKALDAELDTYLLMCPRITESDAPTTYSGDAHLERGRTLWEIARAVNGNQYAGDLRAITGFRSRETPLPIENLCLLLAVLDAAGVDSPTLSNRRSQ